MENGLFRKIVFLMLLSILLSGMPTICSQAKTKVSSPKAVRIWRYSDTSVRLRWGKVKKADGYIVYKYDKSAKKYKIINSKKTNFMIDEVGSGKVVRYKVRAFKKVGGKRVLSEFSYAVWAKAYKKNDKKVNAGKTELKYVDEEKVEADWIELAYYESAKITAKINPSKYSRAKKKKVVSNKLRWYSTDTRIATVNQNGMVTAKGKEGLCTIYTRAHNGKKSNEFMVHVKNYARPDKDSLELDMAYEASSFYGMTLEMFVNYYDTVTDIAEYFYQNRLVTGQPFHCWMENDEVKMENEEQLPTALRQKIYLFVKTFPYDIRVYATNAYVDFDRVIGSGELELIIFRFDETYKPNTMVYSYFEMAPNWFYGMYSAM